MFGKMKKRNLLAVILIVAIMASALAIIAYAASVDGKDVRVDQDFQDGKTTGTGPSGKGWTQHEIKTNGDGNKYIEQTHKEFTGDEEPVLKDSDEGKSKYSNTFYDIALSGNQATGNYLSKYEYITIDLDFMSETGMYYNDGISFGAILRGSNTPSSSFSASITGSRGNWKLGGVAINGGAYEWNHLTVKISVSYNASTGYSDTKYDLILNGTTIASNKSFFKSYSASSIENSQLVYLDTLRIAHNIPNASDSNYYNVAYLAGEDAQDYSFCLDNVKVIAYETGYNGTYEDVYGDGSTYDMPRGYVYACVDGEYYESKTDAAAAINAATESVEIFDNFTDTTLVIGSAFTLKTNGYDLAYTTANGYYGQDAGNGTLEFVNTYKITWHFGDESTVEYYSAGDTPIPPYTLEEGESITVNGETRLQGGGWSTTDGGEAIGEIPPVSTSAEYFATYGGVIWYYSYQTTEGGEVLYAKSDNTSDVYTALNALLKSDYASIKLMSDLTFGASLSTGTGTASKRDNIYFDLAGHTLTYTAITANKTDADGNTSWGSYFGNGKSSTFVVGTHVNMNIFSSKPGGKIFNSTFGVGTYTEKKDETTGEITGTFEISTGLAGVSLISSSNNSTVNVGTVTHGNATHDGDNLAAYVPTIFYGGGDSTKVVNFDGGEYYKSVEDQSALIVYTGGNPTITVKNATLSSGNYPLFRTHASYTYPNKITLEIENSILHSNHYSGYADWNANTEIIIKNSYICTNLKSPAGTLTFDTGVRVLASVSVSGATNAAGVESNIRTADLFKTKLNTNTFVYTLNEADPQNSKYNKKESETIHTSEMSAYISYTTAARSDYDIVNWSYNGVTTEPEKWYKGITPTCPFKLTDGAYYKFSYDGLAPATGGKTVTYTVTQKANIPMLMNISLYTDFVYNIYIPTEYSDVILETTLGGKELTLNETVVLNGTEYYIAKLPITASNAAQHFTFTVTLNGQDGVEFTDTYTLSIPNYAKSVLAGGYNESTKTLMNSTLTYIKAACEYFGTSSGDIGEVLSPSKAVAQRPDIVSPTIASVFSGAQLYLGSEIKFRFNIATTESFTATFTYYDTLVQSAPIEKTITQDDLLYDEYGAHYFITLRARDLRRDIKITVDGESYTYCLSNYVYFIKYNATLSANEKLVTLINSIWDYSVAAESFEDGGHRESVTIGGTPLSEFVIVAKTVPEQNAAAILRYQLLQKTGVELTVTDTEGENSIIVKNDLYTANDFTVTVVDGNLVFASALASFMEDAMIDFARDYIATMTDNFNFGEDFAAAYITSTINYKDMGAVGDGVTDDYAAMKLAHDLAYAKGYTVKVNEGVYNIGQHYDPITIRTDVDWTGATIKSDDSKIDVYSNDLHKKNLFSIPSDYTRTTISADSDLVKEINEAGGITDEILEQYDGTFFGYTPGYKAMLIPYYTGRKVYIRYGGNANDGDSQHELIVIDAEGKIDENTPFLLDYSEVSYIYEYRVDDTPITVTGGTIITVANQAECNYDYYGRGISITRSNTVIRGLEHIITDEGDKGAPYSGFISISNCNNFLAENCKLQGHRYYMDEVYDDAGNVIGHNTGMGTYDIGGSTSNSLVFKNCIQTNFNSGNVWYDENGNTGVRNDDSSITSGIWGIMGTNWCKNITYDTCKLSRLDAHSGVVNASVINSEVTTIAIIGGGTMLVKDSTVHGNQLITARTDYGSTWNGELIIENVKFNNFNSTAYIINGLWYNHNFGYKTYMPTTITIDGLQLIGASNATLYMYTDFIPSSIDTYGENGNSGITGFTGSFDISASTFTYNGATYTNKNPMEMTKSISISGVTDENGATFNMNNFLGSSDAYLADLFNRLIGRSS